MARLEENEAANLSAARDWLDRAIGAPPDPCYVCSRCGAESGEWQSLCGSCSSFDTLVWKNPPPNRRGSTSIEAAMAAASLTLLPGPDASRAPQASAAFAEPLGSGRAIG